MLLLEIVSLYCVCVAMNGHPECLRLLMSTNDQHINVDVQDTNGQ